MMNDSNERKRKISVTSESCPYLDTVNRSALDFDLEPSCSISLESGPHIYGCLVCGKFLRGRGKKTPAYTHSVEEGHFIFIHLQKGTFHCLPDDYLVHDTSLSDIAAALHPTFQQDQIVNIDARHDLNRDLFGRRYLPGFVGLNNLQKTDYVNATVQALAHVKPLRDFFLQNNHNHGTKEQSPLVMAFGDLVRKLWSDQRFKAHVDPHLLLQAISVASKKRFNIGHQAEAGEFISWFLHQLHLGLGGDRNKSKSSIIHTTFQGKVQVTTKQAKMVLPNKIDPQQDDRAGSDDETEYNHEVDKKEPLHILEETTMNTKFLLLTLDIPEKPLYKDDEGGLVIPQEPLVNVLKKFDGISFSDALSKHGAAQQKRYRLIQLPNYLILHLARFKTNQYSKEKNSTIVPFPLKHLDLTKYVYRPTPEQLNAMTIPELQQLLMTSYGKSKITKSTNKEELVRIALELMTQSLPDMLANKYDLVANITHDSPADVGREGKIDPLQEGSYKCHVQHKGTGQWYAMQDLHVQETMPQLIGLSESYVLIFERKQDLIK